MASQDGSWGSGSSDRDCLVRAEIVNDGSMASLAENEVLRTEYLGVT